MRRERLIHLVCALLGAVASLITILTFAREEPPAPAPPSTPAPEIVLPSPMPPPESDADVTEIVYRTPSGKRYHRASCFHVKGKGTALSLAEAKERGLTPCKVCNPPPLP